MIELELWQPRSRKGSEDYKGWREKNEKILIEERTSGQIFLNLRGKYLTIQSYQKDQKELEKLKFQPSLPLNLLGSLQLIIPGESHSSFQGAIIEILIARGMKFLFCSLL